MRNIVRVIIYIWLIWIWWLYRYQHPTRHYNFFGKTKTQVTVTSWDIQTSWNIQTQVTVTSWNIQTSWSSIIEQIAAKLTGSSLTEQQASGIKNNPFGEAYITITDHDTTTVQASWYNTQPNNTLSCISPRGKSITEADRTLAFLSDQANTDNICIIEKRVCTQWVLGGSYAYHTCYFNKQGWQYEYLGMRWSDSTILILQTEQQLGINSKNIWKNNQRQKYTDDTKWISNYALIDPNNNYYYVTNNIWSIGSNISLINKKEWRENLSYNLWPITARVPEIKFTADKANQINPNSNGVQWIINNKWDKPYLNYSSDNIQLESSNSTPDRMICKTPWGTEVFHNQDAIAFQSSSVAQWQSCKSELRTCTQWYLRWSYTQQTCTIE